MEMEQTRTTLKKVMSGIDVFTLAFGAMIGWGWVVLADEWLSLGGIVGTMAAFAVGAVMCSLVGLVYAELTSAMPVAGGAIAFAYKGLGDSWAWFTGWAATFAYTSVAAFESVAIVTALNYIWPIPRLCRVWVVAGQDVYLGTALVGVILGLGIGFLNWRGARMSSAAQNVGTGLLILAGVAFVVAAALRGSASHMSPVWTSMSGVAAVSMMVPFLMVGFDVIPQSVEEMDLPQRSVGRLLMMSVFAAVVWYVCIALGLGYAVPAAARSGSEVAVCGAMEELLGSPVAGKVLAFGGICGILTSWNAFFVAATRAMFAMARAKMLPPVFGRVSPSTGVPGFAIVFVTVLCCGAPFLGSGALLWFVNVGGFLTCITYFVVSVAFLQLRRKAADMERPFRAGRGLAVGVAAVIVTSGFTSLYLPVGPSSLQWPSEWLLIILWVISGLVFRNVSLKSQGGVTPEERSYLIFGSK